MKCVSELPPPRRRRRPPRGGRGLKLGPCPRSSRPRRVAPLAGAWIEIRFSRALRILSRVAPLAGAWIEINQLRPAEQRDRVAPLAGGVK